MGACRSKPVPAESLLAVYAAPRGPDEEPSEFFVPQTRKHVEQLRESLKHDFKQTVLPEYRNGWEKLLRIFIDVELHTYGDFVTFEIKDSKTTLRPWAEAVAHQQEQNEFMLIQTLISENSYQTHTGLKFNAEKVANLFAQHVAQNPLAYPPTSRDPSVALPKVFEHERTRSYIKGSFALTAPRSATVCYKVTERWKKLTGCPTEERMFDALIEFADQQANFSGEHTTEKVGGAIVEGVIKPVRLPFEAEISLIDSAVIKDAELLRKRKIYQTAITFLNHLERVLLSDPGETYLRDVTTILASHNVPALGPTHLNHLRSRLVVPMMWTPKKMVEEPEPLKCLRRMSRIAAATRVANYASPNGTLLPVSADTLEQIWPRDFIYRVFLLS